MTQPSPPSAMMPNSTADQPQPSQLSTWLGVALAILLLAGGAWFIFHTSDGAPPAVTTVSVQPSKTGAAAPLGEQGSQYGIRQQVDKPRGPYPPGQVISTLAAPVQLDADPANWSSPHFSIKTADGVYVTSPSTWSIKGGRCFMQVVRTPARTLQFRYAYPFKEFVPKETMAFVQARWSLNDARKLLDPTPQQWRQLNAISPATDVPVSSEDRNRLRALFDIYVASPQESKPAAEDALTAAVKAVDEKYQSAAVETLNKIAAQFKAIFNEQQQASIIQRFGNR